MSSERDQALNEATPALGPGKKVENVIIDAEHKRLALEQAHALKMRRTELGWFGRIWGDQAHAPIVVAFVMLLLSLCVSLTLWILGFRTGKDEFWSGEAHIAFGGALTALGYIFGKGSGSPKT